ncbi:hypothetical protein EG68_05595 [Paragonimus skrjabini miyazakii]|uniref:tRNA 2-thiocytidine biosynthesis protein TtcA n=1 Tax=Paragonimus skrjabini miyazakii TaxID=59628 RepID=A0A8S9YPP6_9TREM|nr:hypothetical protein EG68_05595 [Paragonimus skrjabini miyazakii]
MEAAKPKVESISAQELGCKLIVCMAAASNVTGILVDVNAFSSLTHRYGGLAFWDYATAAPYVKIDMNPIVTGPNRDLVYKDAVYFSMHKFIGGPQTPGVLIAKRSLFSAGESQPSGCGGGTVFFVRRDAQVYLKDVEEREEGGTPAIVESIRAGLVMQLKEAVTCEAIMEREEALVKRIWDRLSDCRNLIVLGGKEAQRLPIISVVIRHSYPASGNDVGLPDQIGHPCLFLHHNFVSALLNDLFGIQSRGGCACAGPYAMDLLGIDEALAKLYEETLVGCRLENYRRDRVLEAPQREVIRPGFVRVSLPFFFTDAEVDFVLDAMKFVATHGWVFLPLYRYNPATGEWIHRQHDPSRDRKWLSNVQYAGGKMSWSSARVTAEMPPPESFEACLKAAYEELCRTLKMVDFSATSPVPDDTACFDEPTRELRWFLLPSEAAAQIRNEINQLAICLPHSAPWHPGLLSTCFCPDLTPNAKRMNLWDNRSSSDSYHTAASPGDPPAHLGVPSTFQQSLRPSSTVPLPPGPLKIKDVTLNTITLVHRKKRGKRSLSEGPPVKLDQLNIFDPSAVVLNANEGRVEFSLPDESKLDECPPVEPSAQRTTEDLPVPSSPGSREFDRPSSVARNNNAHSITCIASGLRNRSCPLLSQTTVSSRLSVQKARLLKEGGRMCRLSKISWQTPPKDMYRLVLQAIRQFDMIRPGDRVLVCLSGGKDSLSLLHCLRQYQYTFRHNRHDSNSFVGFDLAAVTVDPGTPAYDPSPLIPYLADLGVPYFFEKQGIIRQATNLPYEVSSICSFCSRMKRGRIYACARRNRYNVIALGQHLDDIAESFVMSCFHNGVLLTMKANYTIRRGDLRVVRPLTFVREQQTRKFADKAKLPVIPESCPACFEAPKERFRVKRMLAEQELLFPRLFSNLVTTMMPLIGESSTRPRKKCSYAAVRALLNETIAMSEKNNHNSRSTIACD